jgi:ATP-dependent protease Clp ATPase subunit
MEEQEKRTVKIRPMACSFCGTRIEPPVKGAPKLAVAGPNVFICRDCVGICMEVMAESDPVWRDQKIEALIGFRSRGG